MKRLLLTSVVAIITATTLFGQSPEGFNFQAVVRNAANEVLTNQRVGIRLKIEQGLIGGTAVYTETFIDSTNAYGLVNLEIGTGTTLNNFATINWANGPYYIETAVDVSGGVAYTVMGTSQLMSVPYALHAKSSTAFNESIAAGITAADTINWNNETDPSPTNELQSLSFRAPSLLSISRGNSINLSTLRDNLGSHVATTNIQLNGHYLSGDGGNEGIIVDNGGQVGIGTTAPTAAFHLTQGGVNIADGMRFTSGVNPLQDWYFYMASGDNLSIRDDAATVITFENNTHDVGIGTINPTATLSVNGTANKVGGGSWSVFSDRRIKKDLQPYEDGLQKILQISPVKFKYIKEFAMKKDPNKEFVGIIAQDMQQVAPYMVDTFIFHPEESNEEGGHVVSDVEREKERGRIRDGEELLSYDPSALVYMLVNAVKEQQESIELLKSESKMLKETIENLTNRLEKR